MGGSLWPFRCHNQGVRELVQRGAARQELQGRSGARKGPEETVILRPQPSGAPVDEFRIVQEDDAYVVEGEGLCA